MARKSSSEPKPSEFRPYLADDGVTLEFHCDARSEVVVATRLLKALVDEINRLRSLIDAAESRRMDVTLEGQA